MPADTPKYSEQEERHLYATWQFKWFEKPATSETWDSDQWIAHIDAIDGWRPVEYVD